MTSQPPSLRDLYTDTTSAWAFVPNQPPQALVPNTPNVSTSSPSFQWASRPSHNSIFDLSPDLTESGGLDFVELLRALAASAVLQYTSSAIAMPWEVGKTLLQVQWVPRESHDYDLDTPAEDDDDAMSESSNENENESYFADPERTPKVQHPSPVDSHGHRILHDLEYVIPVGSANGVWGMIRRVGRFRGESWLALWKGLLTSCTMEVLAATFQPVLHNVLQAIIFPSTSVYQQPPLLLPVISHVITGFLVSPLDLVRTRLIVQSFLPQYRSYTGPIDALKQIARDEGGIKSMYFHPQLFIPTIIDVTLRPLVSLALPGLLASYLGVNISQDSSPIIWGLSELAGGCMGLLLTLPFETIRRRLQVQPRGRAQPIKGCVQLRPQPYNGVVDTFWHILTEERSDLPIATRHAQRRSSADADKEITTEDSWLRHTGVGQLYRGLGMRLSASVIVFFLAIFTGSDAADSGWAEL